MSELHAYLVLIPLLPLTAAVLVGLLGHSLLRQLSHWPVILAGVAACGLSILVLWKVAQGEGGVEHYYTWFQTGDVNVGFNLRADGLSAVMLVMVTFVGTLIVIYSSGYMHHDPGYPRYFAEIALFIFSWSCTPSGKASACAASCWSAITSRGHRPQPRPARRSWSRASATSG
jgi:NADH-quinone oxidoreductase subunit L